MFQIAGYIHRSHQKLASTHLGFNHHTELSAHVPGIYRLDCRLIILRELTEIHHLRLVQQFPPVQVCPVIRREISEERMSLVDGSTRGMRRTHLKPTGVPEHRQIGLLHIFAHLHLSGSQKQHLATLLQHLLCLGIQTISNIDILKRLGIRHLYLRWIHPEIPMVTGYRSIGRLHLNLQDQLRWRRNMEMREIQGYIA